MKTVKNFLNKLWKDESAQGATEYILLLVVVVGLGLMFRRKITDMMTSKMDEVGAGVQGFQIEN